MLFRVFPTERSLALSASLFALLTLSLGVMLRSAQTALFLHHFDASWLPYHYAAVAVCMMGVSILYAKFSQGRTWRLDLGSLVVAALLLLGCRLALLWFPSGPLVFCIAVLALLVSQFTMLICFTSINISLDSRQTKRILPLVGAGATLGSMMGGAVVALVAAHWQNDALFSVASLWLLGLATLPLLLHRLAPAESQGARATIPGPSTFGQAVGEGLTTVAQSPYLRNIAAIVALCGASQLCIDFLFKVTLKGAFDKEAMSEFLGMYYVVFNSLMLLSQLFVVGRVASVFRLGTLAMLSPAAILIGSLIAGAAFAAGTNPFLPYVALELLADLFVLTLFSQSRDAAYAPIGPTFRRQANVLIRGVIKPATTLGGSVLIIGLARLPSWAVLVPIAGLSALWLWRAHVMGRLYFEQVRKSLKKRQLLTDGNTNASMAMDGETLRHLLAELPRMEGQGQRFALELLAENGHGADYCRGLLYDNSLPNRLLGFSVLAENFPDQRNMLLQVLQRTDNRQLLRQGIRQLKSLPDEQLAIWAQHDDPWVRAEIWALDRFIPPELSGASLKPLGLSTEARRAVAYALGNRRGAVAILLELLQDGDIAVQREAIASAGRRKLLEALPLLLEFLGSKELAPATVDALVAYGDVALDSLLVDARERPRAAQRATIRVLSRLSHPQAEKALIGRLQVEEDLGQFDRTLRALLRGGKRARPDGGAGCHDLAEREILRAFILRICRERIAADLSAGPATMPSALLSGDSALLQVLHHEADFQHDRCWYRIFALLELSYGDGETVRNARLSWQSADSRLRAFALEALHSLVEPRHGDLLVPLMEGGGEHTGLIQELDHVQLKAELQEDYRCLLSRWGGPWVSDLLCEKASPPRLDWIAGLGSVSLFQSLSASALEKLSRISELRHFEPGQALCRQGDDGFHLYSICSGSADVLVDGKPVNVVGPGAAVGEVALLDGFPRTATVIATSDLDALEISRDAFLNLVGQEASVARGVISGLVGHLRRQ